MGLSSAYVTIRFFNDPSVQQALAGKPISPSIQLAWAIAGMVILIACGALMLKGVNAARLAYLIYTPVSMLFNAIFFGASASSFFPLLVFLVFAALLLRPAAKAYFERGSSDSLIERPVQPV